MTASLYVDPQKGGYILLDNKLAHAPAGVVASNQLLLQKIGEDMYNPSVGNPLLDLNRLPTRQEVINGIAYCLNPLIVSGEIVSAKVVNYEVTIFSKAKVTIDITLPNGDIPQITWAQ